MTKERWLRITAGERLRITEKACLDLQYKV
jgi:hypothetical protein